MDQKLLRIRAIFTQYYLCVLQMLQAVKSTCFKEYHDYWMFCLEVIAVDTTFLAF